MNFNKFINTFFKKKGAGKDFKKDILYFYIYLVAGVLASSILFFGIILPKTISWVSLKRELMQKEKEFKLRYNMVQENQKLKQKISEKEKDYETIKPALFLTTDISGAVKEITSISRDLEVDFVSLLPLPMKKLKNLPKGIEFSLWKTPIYIKIKTGYAKFLKFIQRIEESNKFIKLENFKIKKNPSTLLVHDIDITLSVYSLQQEKK